MNKIGLSALNFIRKSRSKSFNNGIVYKRVSTTSRQYAELLYNFLPEQLNLEGQWEVAISEISYPSMYEITTEGKLMFFEEKLSKSSEFYYLEPGFYSSILDIVEAMNNLIKEDTITAKTELQLKFLEERKKVRLTLQMKDLVLHSLVRIWDTFPEVIMVMNLK